MQGIVKEHAFTYISLFPFTFKSRTFFLNMSQWFYAVGRGRQVGVFTSWDECKKQVENIANAKYRKFKTHKEAVSFIQECKLKYSPCKSPSKSDFSRVTVDSAIKSMPSTQPSIEPLLSENSTKSKFDQSIYYSQCEKVNTSSLVGCTSRINNGRNLEEPTSSRCLSPQTTLEFLAEDDPFSEEPLPENVKINTSVGCIEETRMNKFCERVERYFSEIKLTMDHVLLKVNDLESKIIEFSNKNKECINENVSHQNACVSKAKQSLLNTYNIPQAVGKRQLSTLQPNDEIEEVPVPPKKIPKIELSSDDEVDGFGHDFNVNEHGYVIVYTDGACENNGRVRAKAGVGVWFGDDHPLNCSEPVQGRATNNTAEIQAAVQAVLIAKKAGVKKLVIRTDSEFMINCITKWVSKWQRNNWKVASGNDVKNKDDLIFLLDAMQNIDVKWEHVRGHRGIHGNEMADALARSGAARYKA